ncbi:hypothetical protein ABIE49_006110 [Bradyrhizobium sp. OAE829]
MFCGEILSLEESPAMLDYSALALGQEGTDAGGQLKYGRFGRGPDVGQYVSHDRINDGDTIRAIGRRSHPRVK